MYRRGGVWFLRVQFTKQPMKPTQLLTSAVTIDALWIAARHDYEARQERIDNHMLRLPHNERGWQPK